MIGAAQQGNQLTVQQPVQPDPIPTALFSNALASVTDCTTTTSALQEVTTVTQSAVNTTPATSVASTSKVQLQSNKAASSQQLLASGIKVMSTFCFHMYVPNVPCSGSLKFRYFRRNVQSISIMYYCSPTRYTILRNWRFLRKHSSDDASSLVSRKAMSDWRWASFTTMTSVRRPSLASKLST